MTVPGEIALRYGRGDYPDQIQDVEAMLQAERYQQAIDEATADLQAIVDADNEYHRLCQRIALLSIRGPVAEAVKQQRQEAWNKCASAREAAEAAKGSLKKPPLFKIEPTSDPVGLMQLLDLHPNLKAKYIRKHGTEAFVRLARAAREKADG